MTMTSCFRRVGFVIKEMIRSLVQYKDNYGIST